MLRAWAVLKSRMIILLFLLEGINCNMKLDTKVKLLPVQCITDTDAAM